MKKYDSLLKFTKLLGCTLKVAFIDLTTKREYFYSKTFAKRPDHDQRREYVRTVFSSCGVNSTYCNPIKD